MPSYDIGNGYTCSTWPLASPPPKLSERAIKTNVAESKAQWSSLETQTIMTQTVSFMFGRRTLGRLVFLGQAFFAGKLVLNQQFRLVSRHKVMSAMDAWVKTLLPSLAKVLSNTCTVNIIYTRRYGIWFWQVSYLASVFQMKWNPSYFSAVRTAMPWQGFE